MAEPAEPIDMSDSSELLELAKEVRRSRTPRLLRHGGEALAMVVPLADLGELQLKKPSAADVAAFRAAAGSWSDIDTDVLIQNLYRGRREGTRPDSRP
jgi:hypothetical protein